MNGGSSPAADRPARGRESDGGERGASSGGSERPVAVVVDYGAGNLPSIVRALEVAGADVVLAASPERVGHPDVVVVPGVGAQAPAMRRLHRTGLAGAIERAVDDGGWYLGICLGLQVLFERSEEDGSRGLGWLRGDTRRLRSATTLPHIGWNGVDPVTRHPLLDGLPAGVPMYFVHSYAPDPEDRSIVVAETEHGGRFASVIAAGRLLGVQFHPEKSGRDGIRLLRNALAIAAGRTPGAELLAAETTGPIGSPRDPDGRLSPCC
ncbi:MAG: imidazole glycerol phosphate synthase subunit HisH [Chloroflexi bacterium]|nr:imidazole glycerol phosphate synthase subunit HisH [Chloroflexota bacterium]